MTLLLGLFTTRFKVYLNRNQHYPSRNNAAGLVEAVDIVFVHTEVTSVESILTSSFAFTLQLFSQLVQY